MASYFLNTLKDKASSHLQSFAEKMLIQQNHQDEDQEDEEVLDVIVDDRDTWGANQGSHDASKSLQEDFFS